MATYIYEKIKEYLLQLIKDNRETPNYKLPSENVLAKKFNVTRATAKKALVLLEEDGLVHSFRGKGSFISSEKIPAPLVTNNFVCLMIPNLHTVFISEIIDGIRNTLMQSGLELIVCVCPSDSIMGKKLVTNIVELGVKGIIYFPENYQTFFSEILLAISDGFPVVFIDRIINGINISSVASDYKKASANATSLLINRGCAEIGFITYKPTTSSSAKQRFDGYIEAHIKNNLNTSEENVLYIDENSEDIYKKIARFLSENPHIDGVLCEGGAVGLKLYQALLSLKIPIPDTIKVIFFDNEYSDIDFLMPVKATYVKQDGKRIGQEAAKIILNLLKTSNAIINNSILIDCSIVEQDSTKLTEAAVVKDEDVY